MIWLALAIAGLPAAQQIEVKDEIVVLGTKMKQWKARVQSSRGKVTCITQISSGDPAVDAIGCSAMSTCIERSLPRLLASADKRRSSAERKALNAAVTEEIKTCTSAQHETLLAALAERRFFARHGSK